MPEDVAQLIERRSGTPLTEANFLVRQGIFLPESTFSADSLTVSLHPRVQSHALTSVRTLEILQSMSEFGGLWKH